MHRLGRPRHVLSTGNACMPLRFVWYFPVLNVLLFTCASAQSPTELINQPELLCAIEYRLASSTLERDSITCRDGADFFFLSENWYQIVSDHPDCSCDADFDSLTGCEELLLCLDTANNDTDGDCLGDGLEILLGLDPRNRDSDGDQVPDGEEVLGADGVMVKDEDFDQDGLTNCEEISAGTNPTLPDTDGDGWNDETEVTTGKDPLDPSSKPSIQIVALKSVNLSLTQNDELIPVGPFVAYPPIGIEMADQPE